MKVSPSVLLLSAALGTTARPSGRHGHMEAHRSLEKRDEFAVNKNPANVVTEYKTVTEYAYPASVSQAPAAKPTIQSPPVVKPQKSRSPSSASASVAPPASVTGSAPSPGSSSASSSGSDSGSSGYKPFCGGKSKRATAEEVGRVGKTGTPENYGCNLMVVDPAVATKYEYTIVFTNARPEAQKCVCWLKIGPDGGVNGFFNGNQVLNFDLPAGGKRVVAADSDTQGGCACGVGSVPLTKFGQFASTWVEFDFASRANKKWSGADSSCLVSAAYGMDIPALKVCDSGNVTCSTIFAGGSGTNAYLGGMEALDGVGLNIPPGPASLEVTVG